MQDDQIKRLKMNCKKLNQASRQVIIITQNRNLEDELVKSLEISNILQMYRVENLEKHKKKIIDDQDLLRSLEKLQFIFEKFWNS